VQKLQKQVEASPEDSRLRLKLGDSFLKIGDSENAIKEYLKVAELYEKEDLNTKAISIYKKILSLNSNDTDALHRIAKLYILEGLEGSARNCYLTILKIRPDDTEAQTGLEEIDRSNRKTEPLRPPPVPPATSRQASVSRPQGGKNLAPEMKKAGNGHPPEHPSRTPDPPVSNGDATDAPLPPPKDSEMHYHLGIAYREMELYDYAIAEFEQACESSDIRFDSLVMLGTSYMDKDDYTKAIESFKKASEIKGLPDPKMARLYYSLGTAYEANGMVSAAIDTFRLALNLDESLSDARKKVEALEVLPK
jgi:tetratricopeptide (TPR) repeat protein